MRAAPMAWITAALLAAACDAGTDAGSTPAVAFPSAGAARFVISPSEDGPAWLSEVAFHLVFEGPEPTFGLVEPERFARLAPAGTGEVTATGGRVLGPVNPYSGWWCEPCPESVPMLAFDRIELAPVDTDRDGIADRFSGVFTIRAAFADGTYLYEEPPFLARAEAEIAPASLGAPRLLVPPWTRRDSAAPDEEWLFLTFELPSRVESARIVTAAGDIPVSGIWSGRTVEFRPEGLLPWGETVTLVGEAQVLGAGAALEPFSVEVPVVPRPAGTWTPSFEFDPLDGLAVTHGSVTPADANSGLPALDGERFLLVEGWSFGLVFEVDVPDTEAPVLRLEARLAYRGDGREPFPYLDLTATGSGGRVRGHFDGGYGDEVPLAGGTFRAASATASADLPLAAFRGTRAVVRVSGSLGGTPDTPPADVALQLDGLRVVP